MNFISVTMAMKFIPPSRYTQGLFLLNSQLETIVFIVTTNWVGKTKFWLLHQMVTDRNQNLHSCYRAS